VKDAAIQEDGGSRPSYIDPQPHHSPMTVRTHSPSQRGGGGGSRSMQTVANELSQKRTALKCDGALQLQNLHIYCLLKHHPCAAPRGKTTPVGR
jgi:hypothetical protein